MSFIFGVANNYFRGDIIFYEGYKKHIINI
ncbi:hypothetical protein FORC88_3184 [Salmonella enterica subsp. enterica serovar Typhimurium]|nr:hypothetical protein CFSAN000658_12125 [Salmonella enterica subsp. enterica serovar Abaetetuba str. ATCC 35640]ETB98565.1 hypothetical protein CFSAN004345_13660 [Salmonella enterica subsp. enterica serovar Typhimurium var. 5- str. CFSAN004345]QCK20334.1 hypothetical protein FORC88_3184 [Salmonella enterica subsp. enterica serovar Typhimurium]